MTETARLKWLCRRGMKELDVLLEAYLEHDYPAASAEEQGAFRNILDLDDPVLWYYVMGKDHPTDEQQAIVIEKLIATLQDRD
ncbi:MAG: succinate dehydrogenase assembly factor 2 [Gammaproteobacteria bacterium]|nr:succinate dehydrogenase assembly factor 2 [Gammaproteobacteria bacterium]